MARAQFQVLIIPYRMASDDKPEYAVTKRADIDAWQFLSGGGEDHETPIQAARREANEERWYSTRSRIPPARFRGLDTRAQFFRS